MFRLAALASLSLLIGLSPMGCCFYTTLRFRHSCHIDQTAWNDSRYPLLGIITRDKSLGLSGVIIFTGYETSALYGSYACLPRRPKRPRINQRYSLDGGTLGPHNVRVQHSMDGDGL